MSRVDNNYFTYRQTPATENGTGTLESIKGKTLDWNQLVQNGNFASASGWSSGTGTLEVSNNKAKITISSQPYNNDLKRLMPNMVANHTYYVKYDLTFSAGWTTNFTINFNELTSNVTYVIGRSTNGTVESIFTPTSVNPSYYKRLVPYANSSSLAGEYFEVSNFVLIDLTKMFGAGNEPTTVEEFTSLFPLPYYDYNQGTLLSFNGNGIKTVGKNQFNYDDLEVGTIDPNNGNNITNNVQRRTADYIHAIDNKQYTVSNINGRIRLFEYDANKNYLTSFLISNNETFTLASNCAYFRLGGTESYYSENTQIEIGSTVTSFESYTSSTLSLPISTYFPNGMNGINNVYDELTREKATKRFGTCSITDFGNTSTTLSSGGLHYTDFTPTQAPILSSFNIVTSAGLPVLGGDDAWRSTVPCISTNATRLRVYGTTTDAKTEFSGMQIIYDLATPIETPISPSLDLTFNIDAGGTEELLPVNESTPTTSPILCDIFYRGMIPVSVVVYPIGAGTVTGAGEYRYGETATLVATPNDIYRFLRYEDENGDTLSTDSTYSFEVGE